MCKYSNLIQSLTLLTFLTLSWLISGCQDQGPLVDPFASAQIQIQLVFPEETNASTASRGTAGATKAFDDVTISVLDFLSREAIIKEQPLEIAFSQEFGTNVARGNLSIPITGEFQTFQIVVFAADATNLLFLVGSSTLTLSPGEIRQIPVSVALQGPNLIAQTGTVTASSVFQGRFPASLGVDFNFGTSWFSAGSEVDGQQSIYTWTAPSDRFIATCGIVNNSNQVDPNFQDGFGFETVTFQVYSGPDGTGNVLFEKVVDYPKTDAVPFVKVTPLVRGRSIKLLLHDHEDPSCGGFSELLIVAE